MTKPLEAYRLLPVVAAALIRDDGAVLLQKRPEGRTMAGLWEFPGGKIEPGERPEAALSRELGEELAIAVAEADLAPACFASAPLGERHLLLLLFAVRRWAGEGRYDRVAPVTVVRQDGQDGRDN